MKQITVRVPATTANLGPGFDCIGCALGMYNTFTYTVGVAKTQIRGCEEKYCNEENLALTSFYRTLEKIGAEKEPVHLEISATAPGSRGLGSSATCILGGIIAANALHQKPLSEEEVFALATEMEGHPDNIAPALFGGLTASAMVGGVPVMQKYRIAPGIRFVVMIPDFELETRRAREVLPRLVPFADAIANLSHTALLLRAIEEGNDLLISEMLTDRLHQPYRKELIPGYDKVEGEARKIGVLGFCLSGAGPSLLALTRKEDFAPRMKEALSQMEMRGWQVLDLAPDHEGACILPMQAK